MRSFLRALGFSANLSSSSAREFARARAALPSTLAMGFRDPVAVLIVPECVNDFETAVIGI